MFKTNKLIATIFMASITVHEASAQQNEVFPQSGSKRAYTGQSYDIENSDYIPGSRIKQHVEFLDHKYVFPAKPRNMLEVGVGGGLYNIFGDVPGLMLWQNGGYGLHGHIRKAWGYVISTRLQYNYGIAKGLQWQESENYRYNPAWNQNYYAAGNAGDHSVDEIHYNYRMESHQLNFDVLVAANNIRFHKARSPFSVYGFVGIGALAYKTYVNSMNGSEAYNYDDILGTDPQIYENAREIRVQLQKGMDDSYEHAAESEAGRAKAAFGNRGLGGVAKTFQFIPSVGAGFQIRLSKHVNFSIEDRVSIPIEDDLMDGQRWAEQVWGSPVQTQRKDILNYCGIGFNFNIGNSKRNVEPLYWINPMIYAWSQFDTPSHMMIPEIVLEDADEDGIANSLDKCPTTPRGVAVDAHGCPMDTDGDGIPDYRDKQLITPTECQPVDMDGIGKCPCPEGCNPVKPEVGCANIHPENIHFTGRSTNLTRPEMQKLDMMASQMMGEPYCLIILKSHPKPWPRSSRTSDARRADIAESHRVVTNRMQNIVDYLTGKGISASRIRWRLDENISQEDPDIHISVPMHEYEGWPTYKPLQQTDEMPLNETE